MRGAGDRPYTFGVLGCETNPGARRMVYCQLGLVRAASARRRLRRGGTRMIIYVIAAYLAVGLVAALAFVSFGVTRLLPHPAPVSFGARILLIPGAAALWPYVLLRWAESGHDR